MSPRSFGALLLVAVASCAHAPKKPATLEDDLATIAPVEASFDEDIPNDLPRVVVSTTEIRISGDPYRVARVPLAKDEVEGYDLLPLRLALVAHDKESAAAASASASSSSARKPPSAEILHAIELLGGSHALVVADKRTTFAVLAPVLATAASGVAASALLVVAGKKPSVLALRTSAMPHDARKPDLAPRVTIDERGVAVSVSGRGIGRGCKDEGPTATLTVPKVNGEHDDAALDVCAKSLHTAFGELADEAFFVDASPETDLATLVRVIVPFRRSFPQASLTLPRSEP